MAVVERSFQEQGYQVVRNKVFSGGYITRHYGQLPHLEALQIETRYTVYLNPDQLEQADPPDWQVAEFAAAQSRFAAIFAAIVRICA